MPASSKEFLHIQATTECGFTRTWHDKKIQAVDIVNNISFWSLKTLTTYYWFFLCSGVESMGNFRYIIKYIIQPTINQITISKLTNYSMTSVHHLANNKLDSHISTPVAVIVIFIIINQKRQDRASPSWDYLSWHKVTQFCEGCP